MSIKILNRPFHLIALGGCNDISTLDGHNYTYEGSIWGKLVNILMKSQCMNTIKNLDELDKISNTHKGNYINGLLTHLIDPIQNKCFNDKYFDGIDIDFSKVFFIFSYNNINLINPILKDRLTIIKYDNYTIKDKIKISNDYLIPNIADNMNINSKNIIIKNDVIKYIIEKYVITEKGVRNLNRVFQDIYMKINLLRFINIENNKIKFPYDIYKLNKIIKLPIQFPINIATNIIDIILKKNNSLPEYVQKMYI